MAKIKDKEITKIQEKLYQANKIKKTRSDEVESKIQHHKEEIKSINNDIIKAYDGLDTYKVVELQDKKRDLEEVVKVLERAKKEINIDYIPADEVKGYVTTIEDNFRQHEEKEKERVIEILKELEEIHYSIDDRRLEAERLMTIANQVTNDKTFIVGSITSRTKSYLTGILRMSKDITGKTWRNKNDPLDRW